MIDFPLMTYVATMSVTPGPNNLMLAASGVNHGFRRTLPHLFGVSIGHGIQVGTVAALLGWVMLWLDRSRLVLVLLGCSYLLWLAWRQTRAGQPGVGRSAQPLGFIGAAMFQWVNPKAWVMVLNTAILFFPRDGDWRAAVALAVLCAAINFPCITVWAAAGDRLRFRLREPLALRVFNYSMALLLAATALWIMVDEIRLM